MVSLLLCHHAQHRNGSTLAPLLERQLEAVPLSVDLYPWPNCFDHVHGYPPLSFEFYGSYLFFPVRPLGLKPEGPWATCNLPAVQQIGLKSAVVQQFTYIF
eukprot:jgi/Botrbrau1/652/Bobra.0161s0040.1